MNANRVCVICESDKRLKDCELCGAAVCKNHVQSLTPDTFAYLTKVPEKLSHAHYCPNCFDAQVAPELASYQETVERAKEIVYLSKDYPGYVRVLRRHTKRVTIEKCDDRRETILRMAFVAAQLKFNALIEAEVESAKIRMGGYQSTAWRGSAMPALIDLDQLERSSLKRI